MTTNISVIGSGAWGTALAQTLADKEGGVTLWTRTPDLADDINATHENKRYLAGVPLHHGISATSTLKNALKSPILLLVTPAQTIRGILNEIKPIISDHHKIILCSKGIELETGLLMSDIAAEVIPKTPCAILSGPNFASEISIGKPAATTLACTDNEIAKTLQNAVASPYFRPYISNDIIGAQIAGALKNVIAIACGIAHGMDMGESARASLVTRGLAEIARLGVSMGAQNETFLGLCGVGDIMLTCSSEKSRNFTLGLALGQRKTLAEILQNRQSVTEGIHTAAAAITLARKYNVHMPISMAVHKCLNEGLAVDEALHLMLNRPLGHEL